MRFKIVLTSNCIAVPVPDGSCFYSTHKLIERMENSDCSLAPPSTFRASHSLAAHLGGGRGGQGGVPVTGGPKVSGFRGCGEGNLKVWDTVTGETLTATPPAIPSAAAELLAWFTHKFCYR